MQYTILIAEDDEDIVALLRLYLENSGYLVKSADSGIRAQRILETEHVDLALLDVMMPGMNGYELTRRIREKSNIPILILLPAGIRIMIKILGLNLGADDYLTKPFNPMEVVARVASSLRRFYQLGAGTAQAGQGECLRLGELCLNTEEIRIPRQVSRFS